MGDTINLRIARKRAKRQEAEQQAATNRRVHGRSKAEKTIERLRGEKARKGLDQHQIETGEGQ